MLGFDKITIFLICLAVFYYFLKKNNGVSIEIPTVVSPYKEPINLNDGESEESIILKIKRIDPNFDTFKFKENIKSMYLSIQHSYKEKNLTNIKYLESEELYEKHSQEILNYIESESTHIIDNIMIESVTILSCKEDFISNSIKIKIQIKVKQINYTIDEKTSRVIAGHPKVFQKSTYELNILYKNTSDYPNNTYNCVIASIKQLNN